VRIVIYRSQYLWFILEATFLKDLIGPSCIFFSIFERFWQNFVYFLTFYEYHHM
jgi:hypothetical protein